MKKFIRDIFRDFKHIHWIVCIVLSLACIAGAAISLRTLKGANVYNADFRAIESGEEGGNAYHRLHGLSLRSGTYAVVIGYVSDTDSTVAISLDNGIYKKETLPATSPEGGSVNYTFELLSGTDRGRIEFTYPSGSTVNLAYITIISDRPLNYDGVIVAILRLLLIPCVWTGMYFFIHSTHKVSLVVAVALTLLQIAPFILQSELHLGVDSRGHMMRIEGIFYGLMDGQFPVVVYPEWNNSFGQIGVLYPNVFLYIPALFRVMGLSQLGACKLFIIMTICAAAVVALASARSIFKREWQIVIALFAICLDNTHLINTLSAGRIGGAVLAEIFYPLIVAGLIEVFYRNRKKWYLLAYGIAGVFCCHIMSATIVCIGVAIFAACSWRKFADAKIRHAIINSIFLFVGLIFGTFVCFLKFFFEDWGQGNLQWKSLLDTMWPKGYGLLDRRWIYALTLLLLAVAALVLILFRKRRDLIKGDFVVPSLVSGMILIWMSTVAFPWKLLARIPAVDYYASMVQSAHRFLALADCFIAFAICALLEAVVLSRENRRSYQSRTVQIASIVILVMCAIDAVTAYFSFFVKNDAVMYYDRVIGEIDGTYEDYLPAGTQTEWYSGDTGYISDEDAVQSLAYERKGTYVYYSYTNSREGAYVEFPRFYYDGYVAEDKMAEPIEVVKGEHNRTRVYLEKTDTPAIIRMWYHVPWYMTFACALSYGLWVASLMIVGMRIYRRID